MRLQILRALSEVTDATASELAAHSPASYQTLRRHLEALETFGVIRARAPGVSDGETSGTAGGALQPRPDVRESVRSATVASHQHHFPSRIITAGTTIKPDQEGIDRDRDRLSDAEVANRHELGDREGEEDGDHDHRRAGDDVGGAIETALDRGSVEPVRTYSSRMRAKTKTS